MKFRFVTVIAVALLVAAAPAAAAASERPWTEVRSPHFRVLTNGSVSDGRRVAHDFEQMRNLFATEFPTFRLESAVPPMIYAARDELTAKTLDPGAWAKKGPKPAGLFYHGWDKHYVLVRLDTWSQAHQVVYHEYTHFILHMNVRWMPLWLSEGMAEFFGYTRFQEQKTLIGLPSTRYATLVAAPLIPVETLIAADQRFLESDQKARMLYAESWALVHFLTFGPGMEGGKRFTQFFNLVQQGTNQKKAFEQVFGDLQQVDKALSLYVRRVGLGSARLSNSLRMDDKEFTSRVLSPAETEAALGDFHRQTRDYKGARLLIEQALKDNSGLGYAHEQMGFLLFNAGKDAEAAEEFAKAYALDGTLHLSLFAKTMLSPVATSDVPADRNAFHDALLKVVEVNPQFAPAFVQLARLALRNSDPQTAFRVARRAEQLEPSRAGYHLLTGHILLRLGKMAEAAAIARFVADRWAGPDHNEAVELWNRVPEMLRGPSEAVFVSAPEETHTATGTLKSVNCDAPDKSAALVLTHEGKLLAFRGKGSFSVGVPDTLWYGGDHFTLCHHLGGARAVVHYRPASDTSYAGDISEIEVRDDLPETPTAPQ